MQKRGFFLTHSPIEAHFVQNSKDFVVEETPLYEASGSGDHLFVRIRKSGVSTWEALQAFSERVGVKARDIGYAGMKDKNSMSIQTISLPKSCEGAIESFSHPQIKILAVDRHNNKLKIGHLKGNRFFIRLKKVSALSAAKIDEAVSAIDRFGMANYFGFQRFGRDNDNYEKARAFLNGDAKIRGRKMQNFLISALQSAQFNDWLSKRIEISHLIASFNPREIAGELQKSDIEITIEELENIKKQSQFFKIVNGDLMCHYPYGKFYYADDPNAEADRFAAKQIAPTGALCGHRTMSVRAVAATIEHKFFEDIPASGDRRYAWIFPENLSGKYIEKEAHYELGFFLPKGSYATALIEELLHSELRNEQFSLSTDL
ncbi:tRNA pseudouridine synthase D [Campylobacterota bacterium]|nr:tRNA pseudouridine synthase D [Campylobacterota bacterium]